LRQCEGELSASVMLAASLVVGSALRVGEEMLKSTLCERHKRVVGLLSAECGSSVCRKRL